MTSRTRIDKAFDDIEELFKQISDKNKDTLEAALIKPIHERYPFAQKRNLCDDCVDG